MVVEPANAEQVSELVKLANELKFALIPRGGASGLTGGSVPMRRRSVIVRTTRFTKMSPVDHENMSVTLDAGVITQAAIDAVAKTLPALWRAEKMESKAAKAGFAWPEGSDGALRKLEEEVGELRAAVESGSVDGRHGVREEVGDVLFMAAQVAQSHGVDPEAALHAACDKFARRFRGVEEGASGTPLDQLTEQELLDLWQKAKQKES